MTREFKITEAHSGAAFTVRVVTRSSSVEIVGVQDDGALKIRLTEGHNDGAADRQLVEFLAQKLSVNISQIEIVAGENSREKLISVDGLRPVEVEQLLI